MKLWVRLLGMGIIMAMGVAAGAWAQSAEELEAAGIAHFKKAYYEALPQKKAADAAEEFRRAEAAFRGAIKKKTQRVSAYLHLGRTLFVQEKYREAAEIYGAALKIDPGNKPVYLQLASAREMAGDKEGAVEALELLRAREEDPQAIQMIDGLIARMRAKP